MERIIGRVIIVLVKLHLILILIPWLAHAQLMDAELCQSSCGNVSIVFPFGTREGCYMDKRFEVACNHSFHPPKPFLTRINMELLSQSYFIMGSQFNQFNFSSGRFVVSNPVIQFGCSKTSGVMGGFQSVDPFIFSYDNMFTARGCNMYANLSTAGNIVGGCLSICPPTHKAATANESSCYGLGCCQTSFPPYMRSFVVNMTNSSPSSNMNMTNPFPSSNNNEEDDCKSAFMVSRSWSQEINLHDAMDHVPAVLEWAIDQGYCRINNVSNITFRNDSKYYWKELNKGQVCVCGCEDRSRCLKDPYSGPLCQLYCMYSRERRGYNCLCPDGHYSNDNDDSTCSPNPVRGGKFLSNTNTKTKSIFIGCGSGVGFLLLLGGLWSLYKMIRRRQAMKLKQKFFKSNGGLLLEQQMSSTKDHVEQIKIFTYRELEKATDSYHISRILGQGGQGTVYKGMLTDGRVVAVKKSQVVDKENLDHFINEVVILSQINHRNVVKLIGCCLETEVPMLVYEFIPNGMLFQYIHNPNEEFPLTWDMRLRIAVEVAGALAYLHSAACMPIYHRDIKSSNILLDEKFRAKVADFGTSRSILIEQTHVTTRVQGTFGYLDPEYFQSSQFTEKSDVYSFGVVLVELLTGQKPISSLRSVEERNLARYFLVSMEENNLFEILDARVLKEGGKEEVIAMAKLVEKCLNLKGKKRPTMKTVAMELEGIRASHETSLTVNQQDHDEVDYAEDDLIAPWDVASPSTELLNSSTIHVRLDVQPLLPSN